ncbi:MAG: alkaline phosphatase [Micromonosporaceae bacterium]|nr:alkaline phosphatase [Micromonosporaceae bacterium]
MPDTPRANDPSRTAEGSRAVDRRTVLRAAGITAGAAVATPALLGAGSASAGDDIFRHGVASGDPLPDGVLLWTRVTPTSEAAPGSGAGPRTTVAWQVATDPRFDEVVAEGGVHTGPERDHTVKVDVTGLRPAATYWYRFGVNGSWSPVGRTLTAPPADAEVASLRAGVVSCANWEAGHFAAYRLLAERTDLQLVLHLGDYLYEYEVGGYAARGQVIRPHQPEHEILSLADYRIRHGLYKTDPHLQRLHASAPWVITWDDHEIANDSWSGGAENHDPATEGSWEARKAAARRAYAEWMPVRFSADGALQRRLRFGTLAELTMLDLRSYRSEQAAGKAVDDPSRTIAGEAQMEWLKRGLSESAARWKLVGNPVMISRLDVGTLPAWLLGPLGDLIGVPQNGVAIINDQWDGYNADRNRLVRHLMSSGVENAVFLTGDIHTSWANELTTKDTGSTAAAVEFVAPSVTSDNIDDMAGAPPNSTTDAASVAIRTANPHVRWVDVDHHGYGVLDVNPDRCQMDYYFLTERADPASGSRWARGYSVSSGSTGLQRASSPVR